MRSERDDEMTPLGLDLLEALEDVAAYRRGELELPVREVSVPEEVDLTAIRERLALTQQQFAEKFGLR